MIAPSPDWFVGVDSFLLRNDGKWIDNQTFELVGWDSGTDSGESFTSEDADTNPREAISMLDQDNLFNGNALGTIVIEKID